MYSKKSWGGRIDPYIGVKFIKGEKESSEEDPIVSVVIWEWKDSNLLGMPADKPFEDVSRNNGRGPH